MENQVSDRKTRGRPSSGNAVSAADRMRQMRARKRDEQLSSLCLPGFELPQGPAVTDIPEKVKTLRTYLVDCVQGYHYHRYGNPYQRHCSFFERQSVIESLSDLGGMAGEW